MPASQCVDVSFVAAQVCVLLTAGLGKTSLTAQWIDTQSMMVKLAEATAALSGGGCGDLEKADQLADAFDAAKAEGRSSAMSRLMHGVM